MVVEITWIDGDGDEVPAFVQVAEDEDGRPFFEIETNDGVGLDSSIGFRSDAQLAAFRDMLTDWLAMRGQFVE